MPKRKYRKETPELNFIRTTIVKLDIESANSLRSNSADFVVVSLTLLAHFVMLGGVNLKPASGERYKIRLKLNPPTPQPF